MKLWTCLILCLCASIRAQPEKDKDKKTENSNASCPFLRGWKNEDIATALNSTIAVLETAGKECAAIKEQTEALAKVLSNLEKQKLLTIAGSEEAVQGIEEVRKLIGPLSNALGNCSPSVQDSFVNATMNLMTVASMVNPSAGVATYGIALGAEVLNRTIQSLGQRGSWFSQSKAISDDKIFNERSCLFLGIESRRLGCPIVAAEKKVNAINLGMVPVPKNDFYFGKPGKKGFQQLIAAIKAVETIDPAKWSEKWEQPFDTLEDILNEEVANPDGEEGETIQLRKYLGERLKAMQTVPTGSKKREKRVTNDAQQLSKAFDEFDKYLNAETRSDVEKAAQKAFLEKIRGSEDKLLKLTLGVHTPNFLAYEEQEKAKKALKDLEKTQPDLQALLDKAAKSLSANLYDKFRSSLEQDQKDFSRLPQGKPISRQEYGGSVLPLFKMCALLASSFEIDRSKPILRAINFFDRGLSPKCEAFYCDPRKSKPLLTNYKEIERSQYPKAQCDQLDNYDKLEEDLRERMTKYGTPCPVLGEPHRPSGNTGPYNSRPTHQPEGILNKIFRKKD